MKAKVSFAQNATNCWNMQSFVWIDALSKNKTTCGKCLVHCYQPQMREKVKTVMRHAGPAMLLHHPVLAMQHAIDGFKKPEKIEKQTH
jgi:hypothetical protein